MSYVAIALGVASVATAGVGAYQSGKAAKDQAAGADRQAAALRQLFADRNPGATTMEGLAEMAEFQVNVNPLDFQDAGFGLTEDAMDLMREQAEITFEQTVGQQNLPLFNQFLTDNLERANFDFSSLPSEITRTLEGSALSRAVGGPAGLAENLSVENKLRLQQQSEQSAFRALGFRQGFMPDLLNPINTTMDLARFEQQNQISTAGIQTQALGALGNLEMQRFGLEAGFVAPNNAGIGAAANAGMWNAASQGLATGAMLAGTYGNSYAAKGATQQQVPQQTAGTAPSYNWRASADPMGTSSMSPTYNPYYRG